MAAALQAPDGLTKAVTSLSENGQYFNTLIGWFEGQIQQSNSGAAGQQGLQPVLTKTHKYVEDSLGKNNT